MEEVNHLLARPMFVVEAGIDNQADGAEHVVLEVTVIAVGILKEPDFLAQPLRVKRPAFGIGCVVSFWRK